MGTIGVALIGIGVTLGFPAPLVAGAIISGAYFGDKLSPLSDTTNLAPAVAGTDLFTHVRHLLYTTLPAYALALAIFALIGVFYKPEEYNPAFVQDVTRLIQDNFSVGLHTLIAPVVTLVLVLKRMPALPALAIGAVLGAGEALFFQQHLFIAPGEAFSLQKAYGAIVTTAHSGFTIETGDARFDALFSRGGLLNMLNTVLLIITAMFFGGTMEATGMLHRIAEAILHLVRGTGSLVAATISTCIVFNIAAPDQYLSIVVPGRMFREAYEKYGLHPKNLSRALEDGGTVTSVLVPWNTCAAFGSATLGVATISYLPFCFFNLLCPIVGILLPALGLTVARLPENHVSVTDSASGPPSE
jgi:NhaC family Na+:H+ antiporter